MTDQEEGPGRQPPHDLMAERAALGAMMWSPQAVEQVTTLIAPSDYYRPAHGTIHAEIVQLYGSGVQPEPVVLAQALREHGDLDRVGGAQYLFELYHGIPEVGNAQYYATTVAEKSRLRQYLMLGLRLQQASEADDPEKRLLAISSIQLELAELGASGPGDRDPGLLSWPEFLETDFGAVEFLTEPLLQPGGQIALVADGKAGKSLFSLEWALALANGRPFLGSHPGRPYRTMIIDEENPHPEIDRRLKTLGYNAPELLRNLTYLSFPHLPPLDTPAGAAELVRLIERYQPEVLWLDTISRMIQGEENTADTWLQLYRLSLSQLKARGISTVRLDHLGKDRARGSRGSSAKTQDVDHVWELTAMPGAGRMMQLRRTHSRNGIGPDLVVVERLGNPSEWGTTTHQIQRNGERVVQQNEQAIEVARWLDERGVDRRWGRDRAERFLRENNGPTPRIEVIAEAVRIRKQNPEVLDGERVEDTPHPGHDPLFDSHADGTEDVR